MYRIDQSAKSHQRFRNSVQLAALQEMLPDEEIEGICRQLGHTWRNRRLPPPVMVRSMVFRGLHPDHSIASVLDDLSAILAPDIQTPTEAAWCQARSRLPEAVLTELFIRSSRRTRDQFGGPHRWHGRWVFRIDGSSVSMPDEPALVDAFGYANTKHGFSRFPVARVTFIELAGLRTIWDYRLDEYTCSEDSQLHDMWHTLPSGCICLFDKKFGSFYNLAKLRQRRIGMVVPLHQRRDPQELIRQGQPLGRNEWRVPLWLSPQLRKEYNDPSLPKVLWVRLIRVSFLRGHKRHTLWLVTTLMDPKKHPRRQVAEVYRERWEIEPRIGSLKTTLEMNVLRSKTPGGVRREVASIILGHNLVWRLIHEAAEKTETPADRISFAGAVKVVVSFSAELRQAGPEQRGAVREKMIREIARHTNHQRRGRVEPRMVKREPVRYSYLRIPRAEARQKCLT